MTLARKTYRCGTLEYTLPQLVLTGLWLLLAGFVYALATNVPGALLPMQLQELGIASDQTKMVILSTIGGIFNMTVCPYISVASDRHRSRWGRRIPYIFKSMPPIVLALVLFAFSERFGNALTHWAAPWWQVAPATMTVVVIGLTMTLYQFFVMWVGSVIWYIFNDIIPTEMFGRIMAVFNIGISASNALFHYFVFPHARHHAGLVYVIVGALYAVVISLMCIFVREGEYPPLNEEKSLQQKQSLSHRLRQGWRNFREFLRDSFCHRLYALKYLLTIASALSGCAGVYYFFFLCEIGLDDKGIGRLNGIASLIGTIGLMVTSLLAAQLVNRWHPVRIYFYNIILSTLAGMALALRFLFGTLPPKVFIIMTSATTVCSLFINGLNNICVLPMEMMLFPKSRFGSFCAIQALLRSAATTLTGLGIGALFDFLGTCFPDHPEFRYRFMPVVGIPFSLAVLLLAYLTCRDWLRLGGYTDYACPAPWNKDGRERLELLPFQPVRPQELQRGLFVLDVMLTVTNVVFVCYPIARLRLRPIGDGCGLGASLGAVLILIVADLLWLLVRHRIYHRIRMHENGLATASGLLHPGMSIAVWLTQLGILATVLWSNWYAEGRFEKVSLVLCALTVLALVIGMGILNCLESSVPTLINRNESNATLPNG